MIDFSIISSRKEHCKSTSVGNLRYFKNSLHTLKINLKDRAFFYEYKYVYHFSISSFAFKDTPERRGAVKPLKIQRVPQSVMCVYLGMGRQIGIGNVRMNI